MTTWLTILGFILGGGFLTFIQYLITRHDQKHDQSNAILERLNALDTKVGKIEASLDERDAILARTHILRFKDELYNGIHHSQEYFEQRTRQAIQGTQTLTEVFAYEVTG